MYRIKTEKELQELGPDWRHITKWVSVSSDMSHLFDRELTKSESDKILSIGEEDVNGWNVTKKAITLIDSSNENTLRPGLYDIEKPDLKQGN